MKIIILFLTLTFSLHLAGQENKKKTDPIDINYKKCLDSPENQDTKGMIACAAEAKKAWETEMNKYLKLLQKKLNAEQNKKLQASQEAWLKYKEQEFSLSSSIYFGMGGTMWHFVAADNETEFIKQRALRLKSFYTTLNENDL